MGLVEEWGYQKNEDISKHVLQMGYIIQNIWPTMRVLFLSQNLLVPVWTNAINQPCSGGGSRLSQRISKKHLERYSKVPKLKNLPLGEWTSTISTQLGFKTSNWTSIIFKHYPRWFISSLAVCNGHHYDGSGRPSTQAAKASPPKKDWSAQTGVENLAIRPDSWPGLWIRVMENWQFEDLWCRGHTHLTVEWIECKNLLISSFGPIIHRIVLYYRWSSKRCKWEIFIPIQIWTYGSRGSSSSRGGRPLGRRGWIFVCSNPEKDADF